MYTPTRSRVARRRYPSTPPSSKRKRIRLLKRISRRRLGQRGKTKKVKKGKIKKKITNFEKKGVQSLYQDSSALTTSATTNPWLAVGHTTFPAYIVLDNMCQGIIKTLMLKVGKSFESMREDVLGGAIGDKVEVRYYAETGETPTTQTFFSAAAAPYSYIQMANDFSLNLRSFFNINTQLLEVRFVPAAGNDACNAAQMDMSNSRVKLSINSALTLHNVSTPSPAADEDTVDDVDAVALTGFSYFGPGSGSNLTKNIGNNAGVADIGFWPTQGGIIQRAANDNQQNLGVPLPDQVSQSKSAAKAYIPPGSTVVSKLKDYWSLSTAVLLYKILTVIKGSGSPIYLNSFKTGKFAVHAFRREVEPTPATPAAVKINTSRQLMVKCQVISWESRQTAATTYINGVA